ncbi:hypothetical protein GCM10023097_63780 [Streptomyces collinus]
MLAARGDLQTARGVRGEAGQGHRTDPGEVGRVLGAVDLHVGAVVARGQLGVGQRLAVGRGHRAPLGVVIDVGQEHGSAVDGPGVLTRCVAATGDIDTPVAVHVRPQIGAYARVGGEGGSDRPRQHGSGGSHGQDHRPGRVQARTYRSR